VARVVSRTVGDEFFPGLLVFFDDTSYIYTRVGNLIAVTQDFLLL
jgi:hypothetical protein